MSQRLGFNGLCGMQPIWVYAVFDACWHCHGWESHENVCSVRTIHLLHAINTTCIQCNVLRIELESHADTCVVGHNALVIHEYPIVFMIKDLTCNLPKRQRSSMWPSCTHAMIQGALILWSTRLSLCPRSITAYFIPCSAGWMGWISMRYQTSHPQILLDPFHHYCQPYCPSAFHFITTWGYCKQFWVFPPHFCCIWK